jgi:hypothetical protein
MMARPCSLRPIDQAERGLGHLDEYPAKRSEVSAERYKIVILSAAKNPYTADREIPSQALQRLLAITTLPAPVPPYRSAGSRAASASGLQ